MKVKIDKHIKKMTKINQLLASKRFHTETHKQLTFNWMHCHILLRNVYFFSYSSCQLQQFHQNCWTIFLTYLLKHYYSK